MEKNGEDRGRKDGNRLVGWWASLDPTRRVALALISVAAVVGIGAAAAKGFESSAEEPRPAAVEAPSAERAAAEEPRMLKVTLGVDAEGYGDGSSPIMYRIGNDRGEVVAEGVAEPGNDIELELEEGAYSIEWSTAILADGSIYKIPAPSSFSVSGGASSSPIVSAVFERIEGPSAEEVKAALVSIEEFAGSAKTDGLKAIADSAIAKAKENAENNESVAAAGGADSVEVTEEAKSSVGSDAPSPTATVVAPSSSSASSAGAASTRERVSEPAAPAKRWVVDYKTVHHDAVTRVETVVDQEAWDEQVIVGSEYVFTDGFRTQDDLEAAQHQKATHAAYSVEPIWGTVHHPAVTHQETVVVSPAWDERVENGGHWEQA